MRDRPSARGCTAYHNQKPHVVYEPGEEIALDGAIAYSQLPPGTARCKVQLLREEDEQLLEERIQPLEVDASGSSPLFRIPRFHAPQADGVYEIKISIEGKKRNGVFARGNSVLTRTVELVVVGKVPAPSEAQPWQNKRIFHLGQTEESFPLLRKVGQWLQGESEDDRSRAIDLAPGETEYIAMEVVEPGRPLLVGVKYQSIPGSECIVSIMEPNASGKLED